MLASACLLAGMSAQAATTLKLVEVLTSPERTETLKALVQKFESQNPGVHV
jgi:multiple sugar transport system substrate-binding protein